jgi:hypothetical protein
MAKQIVVTLGGKTSTFDFKPIKRDRLMGKTSRRVLDPEGEVCVRAKVTKDGSLLLRSGMTTYGHFLRADNKWIPSNKRIGVDPAGRPVDKVPSTLGEAQELTPVKVEDCLDLKSPLLYALVPVDLDSDLKTSLSKGDLYRFLFNYRADYEGQYAYLIVGKDALPYCLVGSQAGSDWRIKRVLPEVDYDDSNLVDESDDDDLM